MENRVLTTSPREFRKLINEVHEASGWSLRDIAGSTNLHHVYVWQILHGQRRPSRDALIPLCVFGWYLDLEKTDQILESVGYKPLCGASEPTTTATANRTR